MPVLCKRQYDCSWSGILNDLSVVKLTWQKKKKKKEEFLETWTRFNETLTTGNVRPAAFLSFYLNDERKHDNVNSQTLRFPLCWTYRQLPDKITCIFKITDLRILFFFFFFLIELTFKSTTLIFGLLIKNLKVSTIKNIYIYMYNLQTNIFDFYVETWDASAVFTQRL